MLGRQRQGYNLEFSDGIIAIDLEGESMLPTLKTGDVAIIKPQTDIKTGEIAVISSFGRLVVHRIVAKVKVGDSVWYLHRGDNIGLLNSPGIASRNQILGVAVGLPKKLVLTPVVTIAVNLLRVGAILSYIGLYPRRLLKGNLTPQLYNGAFDLLHNFGW